MRSWYLLEESVYKTLDASLGIQRHKGYSGGTRRGAKNAHAFQSRTGIGPSEGVDSASTFRTIKLYGTQRKANRTTIYRRSRTGRS